MRPYPVLCALLLLAGCGRSEDSLAKKAGARVGETVTEFGKGMGSGYEKAQAVPVDTDGGLAEAGVKATIVQRDGQVASVYLVSSQAQDVDVVVRALDADGAEIGRAKSSVSFEKDDAKYVKLDFPAEMDVSRIRKYVAGAAR